MPFVAPSQPLDPVLSLLTTLKVGERAARVEEKTATSQPLPSSGTHPWTVVRWPRFAVSQQPPQILAKPGMAKGVRLCPGSKISLVKQPASQAPDAPPWAEFGFLVGARGRSWVVSPHLFQGAYGNVCFAYDRLGARYAVKVVRLPPKGMSDTRAEARGMQSLARICDEVTRTSVIRTSIENHLCNGHPTSLFANTPWLHHQRKKFRMHDIIVDAANSQAHVVMTAQQGSVWDLWATKPPLPARERYLAARSLAIQGFAELSVMHEQALFMHADVSLGNVLYDRTGRMRLFDFGFAERLDKPNGRGRRKGWRGTLLAPEMIEVPRQPLGAAVDTFALAVAIFEMAAEANEDFYNPFYIRAQGTSSGATLAHMHRVVQRLRILKFELAPLDGCIRAADLAHSSQPDLIDFFAPLAQADAPLAELLLNQAMQLDPARRSTSRALCDELRRLDQIGEPMDWAAYQKAIARAVCQDDRHLTLRNDAQQFVKLFVGQNLWHEHFFITRGIHRATACGWLFALPYLKRSLEWFLSSFQPKIPMATRRPTRNFSDLLA